MGTSLTGREIVVGLKKAATWRTAVACGASDGLLVLSETFKQTYAELLDDSLGSIWPKYVDHGGIDVPGGLEGYLRYEGIDLLLALAMGTAGVPSTPAGGTSARTNSYVLADNLVGIFATLAVLKKSNIVFEYPSTKIQGFKLSGEMNSPVKFSSNGIANKQVLDSAVNTSVTIANVTYPDAENRVLLNSNSTFKITDKSGGVFANTDKVYPSSFEFNFNRPMSGDLIVSNDDIDEPGGTAFPETTLTLHFPRYDDTNHAFFADWSAETSKKMEIHFRGKIIDTNPVADTWAVATAYTVGDVVQAVSPADFCYKCIIAGTSHAATEPTWPTTLGETIVDEGVTWQVVEDDYYYGFDIIMPHLRVIDPDAAISGAGKIPMSLSFQLLGTDSAPTGMAGITNPFQLNIQNTRTTDPLA